jgi:pyrroline-5-carboxylate reductase
MNKPHLIGFIGGGNMASCLVGGLLQRGHPPQNIWICDRHPEKRTQLTQTFGIQTTSDSQVLIEQTEIVVLAVKPQAMRAALTPLQAKVKEKLPLIISVAAGLQTHQLYQWLNTTPETLTIIRAMPNTPSLIGEGMTGLFAPTPAPAVACQLAEKILQCVGKTSWITNEALMDVVTALAGSGPAYFFYFLECLSEQAQKLGLPAEQAQEFSLQTGLGAIHMAQASQSSVAALRQQVTSVGGTTAAGVEALQQGQLATIIGNALVAATERGRALSEENNGTQ